MRILTIENKSEEQLLRQEIKPFDFKSSSKKEIHELVQEMKQVMDQANGIGLAANQIGLNVRVFVARVGQKFYAVFNPEIVRESPEVIPFEEACLSVPERYGRVKRPEKIVLTGYDKNGKTIKIKAWGLLARVFQHEVDHLDGKLFIDRINK